MFGVDESWFMNSGNEKKHKMQIVFSVWNIFENCFWGKHWNNAEERNWFKTDVIDKGEIILNHGDVKGGIGKRGNFQMAEAGLYREG